jgi:hypothetical protein
MKGSENMKKVKTLKQFVIKTDGVQFYLIHKDELCYGKHAEPEWISDTLEECIEWSLSY